MNTVIRSTCILVCTAALIIPRAVCAEENITFREAMLRTLEDNPGVMIEKQVVRQQEGLLTSASGQFDWISSGIVSTEKKDEPLPMSMKKTEEQIVYSIGIGKQLRNGVIIRTSGAAVDFQDDMTQTTPSNRFDVNADITVPILRGRGEKNTGALEKAAQKNLDATGRLTLHNISQRLLNTSGVYWQCLAALDVVGLYEETEKRDNKLVEVVGLLVDSGELPRAYLEQAKAKLYKTRADINNARLDLFNSRNRLAVAMGVSPENSEMSPLPDASFPGIIDSTRLTAELEKAYIRQAQLNRGDFLASGIAVDSEQILLTQSGNNILPKLDFNVKAGYAGLYQDDSGERFYKSIYDDLQGLNTFMSLQIELPIVNNAARGDLMYRKAQLRKAELTREELSNVIVSEVRVAVETLRRTINEFQLARLSAESYQIAVDHEDRNVKSGESSLTSLIDMQDRYLEARLAEKNAAMKYAIALMQLRYVTGSVFSGSGGDLTMDPDNMLELPAVE